MGNGWQCHLSAGVHSFQLTSRNTQTPAHTDNWLRVRQVGARARQTHSVRARAGQKSACAFVHNIKWRTSSSPWSRFTNVNRGQGSNPQLTLPLKSASFMTQEMKTLLRWITTEIFLKASRFFSQNDFEWNAFAYKAAVFPLAAQTEPWSISKS